MAGSSPRPGRRPLPRRTSRRVPAARRPGPGPGGRTPPATSSRDIPGSFPPTPVGPASTAICLLTRLPRALSRGSQPSLRRRVDLPQRLPRLGQHELLLLGRHRLPAAGGPRRRARRRSAPRAATHRGLPIGCRPATGRSPAPPSASSSPTSSSWRTSARASPARPAAGRPSSCAGPTAPPPRSGTGRPHAPTLERATLLPARTAADPSGSARKSPPWPAGRRRSISRTDSVVIPRTCCAASQRVKPSSTCGLSWRNRRHDRRALPPAAQRLRHRLNRLRHPQPVASKLVSQFVEAAPR